MPTFTKGTPVTVTRKKTVKHFAVAGLSCNGTIVAVHEHAPHDRIYDVKFDDRGGHWGYAGWELKRRRR